MIELNDIRAWHTVILLAAFIGILIWAYSKGRRPALTRRPTCRSLTTTCTSKRLLSFNKSNNPKRRNCHDFILEWMDYCPNRP